LSEKTNKRITTKKAVLPLLPLRGLAVFPYMVIHFDVGREKSIKAVEQAMLGEQLIFLVAQKDVKVNEPQPDDIYKFGTVSKIKQIMKLQNGNIRILVEGIARGKVTNITEVDGYYVSELRQYSNNKFEFTDEIEALMRTAKDIFEEYLELLPKIPQETIATIMSITNPEEFTDVIAGNVFINLEDKMQILSETNIKKRMEKLVSIMNSERHIMEIECKIAGRVKDEMDKHQREYYLREQIKAINEELGEKDGILQDCDVYRKKINKIKFEDAVKDKLLKDVDKLSKMSSMSADSSVMRTYLDTVLELPWGVYTKDRLSLKNAEKVLESEHYGLKDVKERIIDFLAVKHLNKSFNGSILCLVGPPGVGKTSIAKSIAKALNRNYVRISLGGIRDEAEIRGHRKTYVGSMPGRIVNAVKQAKSMNAFILLDEIDKLSTDFKGDPSSALLEVLDSEQNFSFRDNFLEIPLDLSKVMFVTTANSLDTISKPLLDRMEVIELSSYTIQEKFEIASRYLVPKQMEKHGLNNNQLKISKDSIFDIINYYTRESGVRNLERQIAELCRKSARKIVENKDTKINITPINLERYLGKRKFLQNDIEEIDRVGVTNGLAWTSVGGDTLQIETNIMPGNGKIELTGQLGEVMKESARTAISFIRANFDKLGVDKDFYKEYDIHVHVPEGAVPKDGPSAGITIATSVLSALKKSPVKHNYAMTGEITLTGRVLPIGGLKEKSIAAHKMGIKNIIIPKQNKPDISDIPKSVVQELNFITVENIMEVFEKVLFNFEKPSVYTYVDVDNKNREARIKQ